MLLFIALEELKCDWSDISTDASTIQVEFTLPVLCFDLAKLVTAVTVV